MKKKFIGFIFFLFLIFVFCNHWQYNISADDTIIQWECNLLCNDTSGCSDTVGFGEANTANDGPPADAYDVAKPPTPLVPYVRAYFQDNLTVPYNALWKDFRHYPDVHKVWNLIIQWVPEDGQSPSMFTLSWNQDAILNSEYTVMSLCTNSGSFLANMRSESNYTFSAPAYVLQRFKIIAQRENLPPNQPETPRGETLGYHGSTYIYTTSGADPDGDDLYYQFDWGDLDISGWLGPVQSGQSVQASHSWDVPGNYLVKVHGRDIYGSQSQWSTALAVEMRNRIPLEPSTPFPHDKASNIEIAPTLSWTGADPDGDLVSFDVYFGSSNPPAKVISNQSGFSFRPGVLAYQTTYQWKVVIWDGFGGRNSSPLWSFSTTSSGGGSTEPPDGNQNQTNILPIADASRSEKSGFVGSMLFFDGSLSYDSDGYLTMWLWNFGDGVNGTGERIKHVYQSVGKYLVSLTVTDDDGATSTDTINVEIGRANRPPTQPVISGTRIGQRNTMYEYKVSSTDPDNDFIQYTLDWGDGTDVTSDFQPNGTLCSFLHSWIHSGKYTLIATATDNMSLSGETTQEVFIDVVLVKDLGFLFDTDDDGVPDSFFINGTEKITEARRLENGSYLLDTTGDGTWGYLFNPQTGVLMAINTGGFTTIQEPWVFVGIIVAGVCIIAVIVYLYKKNYF
jgi:hypothetical protein